jgi:hypothetical protein
VTSTLQRAPEREREFEHQHAASDQQVHRHSRLHRTVSQKLHACKARQKRVRDITFYFEIIKKRRQIRGCYQNKIGPR